MMKITKRLLVLTVLLIISAIEVLAVKVGPVRFDLTIERGQSQEFVLNLIGTKGEYTQNLSIFTSDISMERNGALTYKSGNKAVNSAKEWITIEKNDLTLFEEQKKEIKFSISVPYSAIPGEYYSVIMVEPKEYKTIKSEEYPLGIQMRSRVAVVIVLNVPGRVYKKEGIVYDLKIVETDSLVAAVASFENNGNIHLNVTGEAVIRSADGRYNYGQFQFKAPGSSKPEAFIFPGSIRDFEGALYRKLPTGNYLMEVSFDYGYEFRKAVSSVEFSVKRNELISEKDAQYISLDKEIVELIIPEKGRRAHVVSLTNTDYRPIELIIESDDFVKTSLDKISLKAGEKKNILLSVSVDKFENEKKEKKTIVLFKPDRGKSTKYVININGEINEN